MEGTSGKNRLDETFQEVLEGWPFEWDSHPSHVRRVWGTGYKGELMLLEKHKTTELAVRDIIEGKIVPGTAPHDRDTQPVAISARPKPSQMAGTVHPALRMGRPGGS